MLSTLIITLLTIAQASDIYFEEQEGLQCGRHALNNLLQDCIFCSCKLDQIAEQNGTYNQYGYYHCQTLEDALKKIDLEAGQIYDFNQEFALMILDGEVEEFYYNDEHNDIGLLVSDGSHWVSLRKIENDWWYFDSMNQPKKKSIHDYVDLVKSHPGLQVIGVRAPKAKVEEMKKARKAAKEAAMVSSAMNRISCHEQFLRQSTSPYTEDIY